MSTWTVFSAALLTALATGLGALPFFVVRQFSRRWLGAFNALAAGLMLGASYSLMTEGINRSLGLLMLGLLFGLGVITWINQRLSHGHEHEMEGKIEAATHAAGMKAFMIVGVMTVHSFAEGIGLGVAYGGGAVLGTFITLAIAIHNIPEGLAISLVLVPRGTSPWKAALWSVFSSLPQPLMAVPAFLLVRLFISVLPFGMGVAAGAMIWMAFAELVPDSLKDLPGSAVGVTVTLGLAAMVAIQALL